MLSSEWIDQRYQARREMLKGIHCNFLDVLRALHIQQIGTGITSADRYFHCDFFAFCEEDSIKMLDHAATRMYAREKS